MNYEKLWDLYKKLHEKFYNSEKSNKISKETCTFISMCGDKYINQNVRLLVYGRAVNGWDVFKNNRDINEYEKCFYENIGKIINKKNVKNGFWWVTEKNKKYYNNNGEYAINRSSFWRVISKIYKKLSNIDVDCFFKYIAWSNLYKIAPLNTGNPTKTMCELQKEGCKEILKKEIEIYDPTHILFITGYNWFCDFEEECFEINKFKNDNVIKGKGYYLENGKKTPVIIASRSEGKNEENYAEKIIDGFKKIK